MGTLTFRIAGDGEAFCRVENEAAGTWEDETCRVSCEAVQPCSESGEGLGRMRHMCQIMTLDGQAVCTEVQNSSRFASGLPFCRVLFLAAYEKLGRKRGS